MARPRQPIELLLVKGRKHLTKTEIEERKSQEIKAPSDRVRPPKYLAKDLRSEFNKIAKQLVALGIMTNLDVDALARFIIARRLYLNLTDVLLAAGMHGATYAELLQSQDKLFKQCRQSASDLGLTIVSRCRLTIPKKDDTHAPTEEEKMFGDRL